MHYLVCEGTSTDINIDSLQRVSNTCTIHIYFSFMYYNKQCLVQRLECKEYLTCSCIYCRVLIC